MLRRPIALGGRGRLSERPPIGDGRPVGDPQFVVVGGQRREVGAGVQELELDARGRTVRLQVHQRTPPQHFDRASGHRLEGFLVAAVGDRPRHRFERRDDAAIRRELTAVVDDERIGRRRRLRKLPVALLACELDARYVAELLAGCEVVPPAHAYAASQQIGLDGEVREFHTGPVPTVRFNVASIGTSNSPATMRPSGGCAGRSSLVGRSTWNRVTFAAETPGTASTASYTLLM